LKATAFSGGSFTDVCQFLIHRMCALFEGEVVSVCSSKYTEADQISLGVGSNNLLYFLKEHAGIDVRIDAQKIGVTHH
jgi:hypothetical protein